MDAILYELSIPFALVTATVAGVLAVLSWNLLRESPFGTTITLLVAVMAIEIVYHVGLFVIGTETVALETLLVLGYVLILIAVLKGITEVGLDIRLQEFKHQYVLPTVVFGLVVYAVGGTLTELVFAPALHWVHGLGAFFAITGLYLPVHADLRNKPWNELLLHDATKGRPVAEWMRPIDNAILELLYASRLVLTPAIMAYNIDYSRGEVNRRLQRLESEGLIERVQRGKYQLTDRGRRYIEGDERIDSDPPADS